MREATQPLPRREVLGGQVKTRRRQDQRPLASSSLRPPAASRRISFGHWLDLAMSAAPAVAAASNPAAMSAGARRGELARVGGTSHDRRAARAASASRSRT